MVASRVSNGSSRIRPDASKRVFPIEMTSSIVVSYVSRMPRTSESSSCTLIATIVSNDEMMIRETILR
jgi:hypothetical protein